jgi:hypothetical protein
VQRGGDRHDAEGGDRYGERPSRARPAAREAPQPANRQEEERGLGERDGDTEPDNVGADEDAPDSFVELSRRS